MRTLFLALWHLGYFFVKRYLLFLTKHIVRANALNSFCLSNFLADSENWCSVQHLSLCEIGLNKKWVASKTDTVEEFVNLTFFQ